MPKIYKDGVVYAETKDIPALNIVFNNSIPGYESQNLQSIIEEIAIPNYGEIALGTSNNDSITGGEIKWQSCNGITIISLYNIIFNKDINTNSIEVIHNIMDRQDYPISDVIGVVYSTANDSMTITLDDNKEATIIETPINVAIMARLTQDGSLYLQNNSGHTISSNTPIYGQFMYIKS